MQCKTRTYLQVINAVYRNHEQYAVHAIKHDFGSAFLRTEAIPAQISNSMPLVVESVINVLIKIPNALQGNRLMLLCK